MSTPQTRRVESSTPDLPTPDEWGKASFTARPCNNELGGSIDARRQGGWAPHGGGAHPLPFEESVGTLTTMGFISKSPRSVRTNGGKQQGTVLEARAALDMDMEWELPIEKDPHRASWI